jgi:capsular polysaccharide biosynthesis protein
MESVSNSPVSQSEDLSLYGLFSLFLKNWLILCVCGFSVAIIALIWAIQQPNMYKAETVLMPITDDKGGLGALAGSLGGLASMAGLGMGDSGNDNTKLAMQLIKSRVFIADFVEKNNLLVPLIGADDWNLENNTLGFNEKLYDVKTNTWVRDFKAPQKQIPSLLEAHEIFLKMLTVEIEPKTKFVKIAIEFYSPEMAADWLIKLVAQLNNTIRQIDIDEANRSIEYLEKLIVNSQVSGLQTVFSNLMEEQIKSKMLAEVRKDYVFKVVDPAVAPEKKSKPQRALIIIIAGFLGGIIGLIIILYRSGRQSHIARSAEKI